MAGSEIRDIFSSDRNCQKLPEAARNLRNLKKVIDFVVFPGIYGFRLFFQFCSKLSEIVRNCLDLQKAIDFCGISWYRWISIVFLILLETARNRQKLPGIWRRGRFLEGFPYKTDHLFQFRHFEFCEKLPEIARNLEARSISRGISL